MDFPHDTDVQHLFLGELTRDEEIETLRARISELESLTIVQENLPVPALRRQLAACEKERDSQYERNDYLQGRLAAVEKELSEIHKEAETNQKWAFLEWKQKAKDLEEQLAVMTKERDKLLDQKTKWEASVFKNAFGADEAKILNDVRKQLIAMQRGQLEYEFELDGKRYYGNPILEVGRLKRELEICKKWRRVGWKKILDLTTESN
jgi:chromosome segregation ATPase